MKQTLRPFQEVAIQSLRDGVKQGIRGQLLVAPTGAGKTTIAAFLIESAVSKGSSILFLAHRRELIGQASRRLDEMGLDHGIIMGNNPRSKPHLQVQVGSVQTVVNREFFTAPTLVIVDEAHRAQAATYRKILDKLGRPVTIGLTATPCRLDGRGLGGDLFQRIVECPQVKELTAMEFLVPSITYAHKKRNMTGFTKQNGDFKPEDVASVMNKPELIGDVVKEWQEKAAGRPTIAFASTVAHSLAIVDAFLLAGIPAEHVDCNTPTGIRDQLLSRLASGETQVVSNVGIYDEGVDCCAVSCIIDDAITASLVKYLQRRGRGLRPAPGKSDCIILDHAGNAYYPGHGLPSTPREWTLDPDKKKKKSSSLNYADTIKVCPKCQAVHDLDTLVCSCGYVFSTRKNKPINHKPGSLEQINEGDIVVFSETHMRRQYEWFLLQQHTRSKKDGNPYSKGYAFMKFKSEFQRNPKRGWMWEWIETHPELVGEDAARRQSQLVSQ